jgi:hypothetical protein
MAMNMDQTPPDWLSLVGKKENDAYRSEYGQQHLLKPTIIHLIL